MFVIIEGQAELLAGGRNENALEGYARPPLGDQRIGTVGPGDVVGELSLIDGYPRSASVRALTEVHLLQIAADDFRTLLNSSPGFVRNLLGALAKRIREMDERWPAEL
jgi:CRP-like cAMP-binding protein